MGRASEVMLALPLMNELRLTVNGELRTPPPAPPSPALLRRWASTPPASPSSATSDVVPRAHLGRGGAWPTATRSRSSPSLAAARERLGSAAAGDDAPGASAGRTFQSRLLVGTGKYRTLEEGREAILRSGAEIVTVALRRVDLTPGKPNVLDTIDRKRYTLLPNTAGCYTAEEAIRTCRLARELGIADMVKLEVIGDQQTLFPDGAGDAGGGARSWSRKASSSCPTASTIRSWPRSWRTSAARR